MCGLACLFGNFGPERTRQSVERMLQLQTHRGPDSSGLWSDTVKGVDATVGLRRLKILELSDAASHPMLSEDGRFVLVLNVKLKPAACLSNDPMDNGSIQKACLDDIRNWVWHLLWVPCFAC